MKKILLYFIQAVSFTIILFIISPYNGIAKDSIELTKKKIKSSIKQNKVELIANNKLGDSLTTQSSINWVAKPFENRVFIENKGQFSGNDLLPDSQILFGGDNKGSQIYFTPKGLTFRFDKPDNITKEELEKYEAKERKKIMFQTNVVNMEWLNADPNVQILTEGIVSEYFSYMSAENPVEKSVYGARGYKKIIYKNLYPKIDVEYIFHEKTGIKYVLIVHPGGDPSVIKMRYTGDINGIFKDVEGNIQISTLSEENIIDHAPVSYYKLNPNSKIESYFTLTGDIVSFNIDSFDHTKTLEIDPWVTTVSLNATENKAFDLGRDKNGNVYIFGGGSGSNGTDMYQLQKYNSNGVLQWTFTTTYNTWFGDLAVDPEGNCYITNGVFGSRAKIDANNFIQWAIEGQQTNMELWRSSFSCDFSKLTNGGGGSVGFIRNIDLNTGAIDSSYAITQNLLDEIRGMAAAPNGNIYSLTNLNSLIALDPSFQIIYNVPSTHNFTYVGPTYTTGRNDPRSGMNSITTDYNYIYTFDGSSLIKRDILTGNFITGRIVPSGVFENNSGIAADGCKNLFVGSQSRVYKFDSTFNVLAFAVTPGAVYDISLGINGEIFACGDGFVASLNLSACGSPPNCVPLTSTTSTTIASCTINDGTATVTVTGGDPPYTYSWNTTPIQTDSTATGLAPGRYIVTITDTYGKILSDTVIVTTQPLPEANAGLDVVLCPGDSTLLTASGGISYVWSPSTGLSSTTDSSVNANPASTTTYIVRVTDINGCINRDTVTVTRLDVITATTSSTSANCGTNDGSATVVPDGMNAPYTYSWFPGGQTTATASNLAAGTYICTIADANGCPRDFNINVDNSSGLSGSLTSQSNVSCNGGNNGTATLTGSGGTPPLSYTWSTTPVQNTATAISLTTGYYSCTITDADNCTYLVSVVITEPAPLVLNTSSTPDICRSSNGSASAIVSGGTPAYSYSWDLSSAVDPDIFNLSAGNYSVTVTDSNGCTATANLNVSVAGSLTLNIDEVIHSACSGACSGSAKVTANGNPPYSFSWNTSPAQTTADATGLCPGNYTLIATDADNCKDSVTVTISENAPYTVSFTAEPKEGCAPLCVSFNNTTANTNIATWKFGDGASDSGSAVSHCYTQAGNYSVTLDVTDNYGCPESITVQDLIHVFPNPVANFSMTPPQGSSLTNALIRFTDESTGTNYWLWNFGDPMNSQSSVQNPSFRYDLPGYYTVMLYTSNSDNCTDTISHVIYIEPEFTIYIPSAFTPDSDGLNDFFAPQGGEFMDFEMAIFNRWGEMIYQTTNIDKPWNGKSKSGSEIQEGVYGYKIWVRDFKDEIHHYVGNVTLIK